ncbi:YwqG family protein [Paenibacillus dendritiformis]|uniref:YwqG family protein n=1 Tax=Paenibacillus dendritiformis TaxID=130049 RepID=UPI00365B0197
MTHPMTELHRLAEEQIKEYELEPAARHLMAVCRQGIRLDIGEPDDGASRGRSRVGGNPDLPPQAEWPRTADGEPMTFLAQLNLEQLAACDSLKRLPAQGMLYFFVGIDEPAYDIEHRVIYAASADGLERRAPGGSTALDQEFDSFDALVRPTLEFPNYAYVDEDMVSFDDDSYERYLDFVMEMSSAGEASENWGSMFGFAEGQHGDDEIEAACALILRQEYGYDPDQAMKALAAHYGGDAERARHEVDDMVMLLEIDSSDAVGFQWWDCGVLHFFIRGEDLRHGRFGRTYCSLYSS